MLKRSSAIIVMTVFLASHIWAGEFVVDTAGENSVKFISDAPFDDFEGLTDRIDGYVYWSGSSLDSSANLDKSEFYFEVDLTSLDTGIGLRNRHMRDNYLETEKFPYTYYKGVLSNIENDPDSGYNISCTGNFFIHGVSKPFDIVCRAFWTPEGFRVRSEFSVSLIDFDIEVPSLMFMKISEIIELKLDFYIVASN